MRAAGNVLGDQVLKFAAGGKPRVLFVNVLKEAISAKVAAFREDEADPLRHAGIQLRDPVVGVDAEPPNSPRVLFFFDIAVALEGCKVVVQGKRIGPNRYGTKS